MGLPTLLRQRSARRALHFSGPKTPELQLTAAQTGPRRHPEQFGPANRDRSPVWGLIDFGRLWGIMVMIRADAVGSEDECKISTGWLSTP